MIHSHVQFVPFAHDFCDMFSPGEDTFYILANNLLYGYVEGIDPILYQTNYNWRKAGVAYQIIPQNARAAVTLPALRGLEKEIRRNPDYAMAAIAAFAVHDLNLWASGIHLPTVDKYWRIRKEIHIDDASDYYGYWKSNALSSDSPKVYCGYYKWEKPQPYSFVFVVSNFNRDPKPLRLKIDKKMLLWQGKEARFVDLWDNNKELSEQDLKDRMLKGASFMLIGVQFK